MCLSPSTVTIKSKLALISKMIILFILKNSTYESIKNRKLMLSNT